MRRIKKCHPTRKLPWLLFALAMVTFYGCGQEDYDPVKDSYHGAAYNPEKAVSITDFLPKSGGWGTRVVLYGENFGNDTSLIRVAIGGQPAKVIKANGNNLLFMVPRKAFKGDIQVSILNESGQEAAKATSSTNFKYIRQVLVSTLCGKTYENNTKYDIKAGPFDDCGGFDRTLWFAFDPKDSDMLYCAGERKAFRVFDFKNKYVDIFTTNIDNVSSVGFTLKGDMILSRDQTSDQRTGLYMFTRESGFKTRYELCNGRGVKTVAVHPVNGRVYYTLYRKGEVWSVDPYNPEDNHKEVGLPRMGTGVLMVWHPTGNFCYLIMFERHTIWRSDYDPATGKMSMPYFICGKDNVSNWNDGVGPNVRLSKPWQGFFLKNPDYKESDDQYDFYFSDNGNHCIRTLSPLGKVHTYAGRADGGTKGYREGELRTQAQFYYPEGLVYDAKRDAIYVGDSNNRVVRKIAQEE